MERRLVIAVVGRDVAEAVGALCTPAARWARSADGLSHPGDHAAVLEYDAGAMEHAAEDLAALGDPVSVADSICVVGSL